MARWGAADRGAAAVEAALVLPLLLLLVFGIVDFGRLLNAQIKVTEAAREGARVSSFGASLTTVENRAEVITGFDVSVSRDGPCPTSPDPNADTRVTVTDDFEFITPLAILIGFAGTPTVSSTGVMPCHS